MDSQDANQYIEAFEKRFGEPHLYLAYHAAFPIELVPDLAYCLWHRFQCDIYGRMLGSHWTAVSDLLLCLCDEVGHELYRMPRAVRNQLLKKLKFNTNFGEQRISELHDFLLLYVQNNLQNDDPDVKDFAQAQRLTALAYVYPDNATSELAIAFKRAFKQDPSELFRIASITRTLRKPLTETSESQTLLTYAQSLEKLAHDDIKGAADRLRGLIGQDNRVQVAGIGLDVPSEILRFINESTSITAQANNLKIDNYSPRLEGTATVEMTVNGSPIMIEVDGNDAPITAGNFVDLVERGFYNGLSFHRVVKTPQPFVAQGGDPKGNGTGGFVDPQTKSPRYIPLEIKLEKEQQPIYSKALGQQAGFSVPPVALKHTRGAIAMARSQMPDSASSQFYFALSDLDFLDGDYAVFGYVKSGMEVVDSIKQGDRIQSAKVVSGLENLCKSSNQSRVDTPDPSTSPSGYTPPNKNENTASSLPPREEGGHFSTLRTKITDGELLKATLRDLGITVKIFADVRGYNGQRIRADIVAVLEGEYDLGWSRNSDGSFDLIADLWGVAKKHNQTELINSISQKYAVNKTLAQAKHQGLQSSSLYSMRIKCPRCDSIQTYKYSYQQGKPSYKCGSCGTQFTEP